MPGAQCTRGLACKVKSTRVSHHRSTGNHPAFPHAMVYGLFRVLPGARAFWSPSSRGYLRETWRRRRGVRTTRLCRPHPAPSSEAPFASTASRPAFVTCDKRDKIVEAIEHATSGRLKISRHEWEAPLAKLPPEIENGINIVIGRLK